MNREHILALGAHPDDIEFLVAGTLALLAEAGHRISMATVCTGDMGSVLLAPAEIAAVRRAEAESAAALLDADFHCLGLSDLHVAFDLPLRRAAVELLRQVRPGIVITHSPQDYLPDHQITADLAWDACFNASVPNYATLADNPAEPLPGIPALIYADAIEGKDRFGQPVPPGFWVDISATIETKTQMLACHKSQRDWLRAQHGMDEYLIRMQDWSKRRGAEVGVEYAEVFRQHLGHAFPQGEVLVDLLPEGCVVRRE